MKKLVSFDDLDGGPADATAYLGLGGTWYEIDLTSEHYTELHSLLDKWVAAGRVIDSVPSAGRGLDIRREFRDWADGQEGVTYVTPGGNYSYKRKDVRRFLKETRREESEWPGQPLT
jgi:Lsr2